MGGGKNKKKNKGGGGGKAKKASGATPHDDDMLNPPESRDDYIEDLDQLDISDESQSRDGSQTKIIEDPPEVPDEDEPLKDATSKDLVRCGLLCGCVTM